MQDARIPRTPEEAREKIQQAKQEEEERAIKRAEKINEKIGISRAVMELFKTEAWKYLYETLFTNVQSELDSKTISTIKGNVFEKGAMVENIQGGLAIIESQLRALEDFESWSKQEPVDVGRLKEIKNENVTSL